MIEVKRMTLLTGIEFKKVEVYAMLGAAVLFGIFLTLYNYSSQIYSLIIACVSAVVMLYLFLRPILARDDRRTNINSNIPFFVTAFATLSVSDANRIDILNILSKKDKLGYIREDIGKLVNLVKNWKRGLAEAAMFMAQRTPSNVFADFLARFSHAIDSGQDFEEFVNTEAETVMSNFETTYISALYTFDLYKDMYVSLLLAFAFLIAFIMIMPILIPMNVNVVLSLTLIMIVLGESMLVYGIKMVLPNDPIWHKTGIRTELQNRIRKTMMYAGIISAVSAGVIYFTGVIFRIPFYFSFAILITPFAWPSIVGTNAERSIAKKDDMFGSFIRAVSGSASARGNMLIDALKSIVLHDFGTLTNDIKNLYKRLIYRVNSLNAWRGFSADTGSHLIEVFSESFAESVDLGADAEKAGSVVAANFDRVIRLRRRRHSSVTSYTGVIYGITGGLAFSLAISYGVLQIINSVFSTFSTSTISQFGVFVGQPSSSMFTIEFFLMVILYMHSFIAGTALKVADGGKIVHGLHHCVTMVWIVSLVVYGTLIVTKTMLGTPL